MTFRFWLFLSISLISLPIVTDWLVDQKFRKEHVYSWQHGYSRQDRDAMSRLVEQATAEPVASATDSHHCGDEWTCLLAWAEEQQPPLKHKRRKQ